jgi:hypothetical protein
VIAGSGLILLMSITHAVFAQPEPTEEEVTVSGSGLGVGFLLRVLIIAVIGAIAGIAIWVFRKKRPIF